MHNSHDPRVLPMRDGVNPSCVVLPSAGQGLLVDFLAQRLPAVSREDWLRRLRANEVVDEFGTAATERSPFTPGVRYYYYRELPREPELPFHSPTTGGMTVLAEFEMNTGLPVGLLKQGVVPYYYLSDKVPGLARSAAQSGYQTLFAHPYVEKFWGRANKRTSR